MTTRAERVAAWKQNRIARMATYRQQRNATEKLIATDTSTAEQRGEVATTASKGVRKTRERKRIWTAGEIAILRELAIQGSAPEEVAVALRRTVAEIQKQAVKIGLWDLTDKRMTGVMANTSSSYFTGQKSSRRPT